LVDDPRDRKAYGIGIAFLGLAVAAAVGGIGWVCAEHGCVRNIPNELWFGGGAIVGAFVGSLIPVPLPRHKRSEWDWAAFILVGLAVGGAFILGILAAEQAETEAYGRVALLVTFGGLLLGLPIPSPGRRDG
jgi:ABC-type Fe3+-siderophore transport system permease subunit